MIGASLGPYKILESLGAGGMGEVYLGEDTRLGRKVAIKVLPAEFASDPARLARFEQEARAAAALNHPHIAVVHDVGFEAAADGGSAQQAEGVPTPARAAGVHYIVQEYLEGDPLRVPLEKGALTLKKALDLAIEIAEGLAAAHGAGIVHRDLKPDNVFVTQPGHAKILDFGLAKLTEAAVTSPGGDVSRSPTMLGTVAGQVMGTAGYMAPEQIEAGDEVDQRADVFAFGVVLYEMVTGKRAFSGASVLDTLHAIARSEPPSIGSIDPDLPAELQRILKKAMAKDRASRYQRADELVIDLRRLRDDVVAGEVTPVGAPGAMAGPPAAGGRASSSRPAALAVAAGVVALLVGLAAGWWWRGTASTSARLDTYLMTETVRSTYTQPLAISPDGDAVALIDDGAVKVRRLATSLWTEAGTADGVVIFSATGSTVYYTRGGDIWSIALDGSSPRLLAETELQGYFFGWRGDAGELFLSGVSQVPQLRTVLMRVVPERGDATEIWSDAETAATALGIVPTGRLSDRLVVAGRAEVRGITAIGVVDLDSGLIGRWRPGFGSVRVVSDGRIFAVDTRGNLTSLALGSDGDLFSAEAVPVLDGLRTWNGIAAFDVASNGTVVTLAGQAVESEAIQRLVWFDEAGSTEPASVREGIFQSDSRLSPDGSTLAAVSLIDNRRAIMLHDLERDSATPLAVEYPGLSPVWSPDGTEVMYNVESPADGPSGMYRAPTDRSSPPRLVLADPDGEFLLPMDWHGDTLLYARSTQRFGAAGSDLWTLSLADGEPELFLGSPANEIQARFSSDGAWIAYVSDHLGTANVYARPAAGGGEIAVSTNGAENPEWHPQQPTLFFLDTAVDLVAEAVSAVDFEGGAVSAPRVAAALPQGLPAADVDLLIVAPDGDRFLTATFFNEPPPARLRIVTNAIAR